MAECIIVGSGSVYRPICPNFNDFIIAADGGYDHLKKMGITPHLIVGDLDSIECVPEGVEIIRYDKEKDETDMHLAYLEGAKRGYKKFHVYGGTGGTPDHTFANYCLLLYASKNGHRMYLYGDTGTAMALYNESINLWAEPGKRASIFAFGGIAEDVTVECLKYECRGATLTPDFPLGVSNEFTGREATVSVGRGALLLWLEH